MNEEKDSRSLRQGLVALFVFFLDFWALGKYTNTYNIQVVVVSPMHKNAVIPAKVLRSTKPNVNNQDHDVIALLKSKRLLVLFLQSGSPAWQNLKGPEYVF